MFKKNHSKLTFLIVNTVKEPYDKIKEYELKTRELKEVDFGEINAVKRIVLSIIKLILGVR